MQKISMDLANKVVERLNKGETINDHMIKSAELSLNIPNLLVESRFLHNYTRLKTASKLLPIELDYLAHACGTDLYGIKKVASQNKISEKELVFNYLDTYGVNLDKLAEFDSGQPAGQNINVQNPAAVMEQDGLGNPMVVPTGSIPQMPEMQGGNAEQLINNYQNQGEIENKEQELAADQTLQGAAQSRPQVPKEQIQAALSQADPMAKAKYVGVGMTEDQLNRLAVEIQSIEQEVQLPITDEGQLKKVVQSIQKQDMQKIDEAIKARTTNSTQLGQQMGPIPGSPDNPIQEQQNQLQNNAQKLAKKLKCN